jgi:arylsulfatase A-like enzyme
MACGKFDLGKPMEGWGPDGQQQHDGKCFVKIWGFSDAIDNAGKPAGARNYFKRPYRPDPYLAYLETKGLATIHMKDIRGRKVTDSYPTPIPDEDYADNFIARTGLMLLDRAPKERPWFIQINFNGPHDPWDATKSMKERWKDVQFSPPNDIHTPPKYPPEKMLGVWQNYAAAIENIDAWLGKYIEKLRDRGELDNTIIVYSSDHGEMLGDHGLVHKSQPYHPSVNVPLVVAGPGVVHRPLVKHPVGMLNLTATFLDYAMNGIPDQIQKSMDAVSLRAYWEGNSENLPKYVRSGFQQWRLVMRDRYKLITGYGARKTFWQRVFRKKKNKIPTLKPEILFDLDHDPGENSNIAAENPEIVQELRQHLFQD